MNKYLDQICITNSMVKQARYGRKDDGNELRETGVIGAAGVGSSLITDHIANKMNLNGHVPNMLPSVPKTSFGSKFKKFFSNPRGVAGEVLANPRFNRALKIGAIGGAVGLAADYGAVKINKALDKTAMDNEYLKKILSNETNT